MAITVKQWQQKTGEITRTYVFAVIAALKAGTNIANRRAKHHYIKDRSGPPIGKFLTSRSGDLRASIKNVEPHYDKKSFVMGLRAGSPAVRYAGVHEHGWPSRNIKRRPFLRPALKDSQKETRTQILLAISTLYQKTMK